MRDLAERLNLDFLTHAKLDNFCGRFVVGAYFRDQFLLFGIGLQLCHILAASRPPAN